MIDPSEDVNIDANQPVNQPITGFVPPASPAPEVVALRAKALDPVKWTEEAGPVEIGTYEVTILLIDAMARGLDRHNFDWLWRKFSEHGTAKDQPKLRLALAHLLSISPRPPESIFSNDIGQAAMRLFHAIKDQPADVAASHVAKLAAGYDWPTIAKRNSERNAERNAQEAQFKAEQEAKRIAEERRAAIVKEAKRCWTAREEPSSDEVRDEMIAHQKRERDQLHRWGSKEPLTEFDVRLMLAGRGYGYDDGDFFLADADAAVRTLYRERHEAEERRVRARLVIGDDQAIIEFFDDPKMTGLLPAYRTGGVLEVIGPAQSYKSTLVARLCCAALARHPGLRVLYVAGEQPLQIDRFRKAYGAEEGLSPEDIDKRFCLFGSMPALYETENADRIFNMVETLGTDIVVLDTWARAIAGLNENSNAVADLLAENGPIGRMVADGVLVVIIGHCPLDGEKRLRGHGGANDNADARLWIIGNAKGFKVEVLKMKPLPGGHTVYATVPPVSRSLSQEERTQLPPPTIKWCGEAEYRKAVHDPRKRVEPSPAADQVVASPPAAEPDNAERERPLTRTEKSRLRVQRHRAARHTEPEVW